MVEGYLEILRQGVEFIVVHILNGLAGELHGVDDVIVIKITLLLGLTL